MTAIGDFCNTIRSWTNFEGYSDELITSWVRMAEESLSEDLRCKHMITAASVPVVSGVFTIPSDWQEMDLLLSASGYPLVFKPRDEYFNSTSKSGIYTIVGNLGYTGEPDGNITIHYYASIPPLAASPNWLLTHYSRLYVSAVLAVAASYSVEDERAVMWQTATETFVDRINQGNMKSRSSGSKLIMPRRGGYG